MKQLLYGCGAASLAALAYLCITLALAVRTVEAHISENSMALGDTIAHVNQAAAEWATASKQQAASASAIERDIRVELWQVDRTLRTAAGAIATANEQLAHVGPLLDATRATTEQATSTLKTTQQTIQAMQAPITEATATLQALQAATGHLDDLVSDPHIAATLVNIDGVTSHVNSTSADVQAVVHGYLHPTWAHRIFGWTLDVTHALNPL